MKKVSIITATYNAAKFLEPTIISISKVSYPCIEFILIDGGSTDDTLKIAKKYKNIITKMISEPDKGVYDALNKGINLSTGDYLYFLGAGDVLHKEGIGKLVKAVEDTNCMSLVYGDCYFVQSKKIYNGEFNKWKLFNHNICHQAIIYSRKIFEKHGLYDLSFKISADYILNLKCFADKNINKLYVKTIVADYQEGGLSDLQADVDFVNRRLKTVKRYYPIYMYIPYKLYRMSISLLDLLHLKNILKKYVKF